METTKWAVIGGGGIADRRTIPDGIIPANNSRLVAISDINAQIAKLLGDKYGVNSYSDSKEMLEKEDLDAVYIAIPTCDHKNWVFTAASRGVHILCEKPLGLTVTEAQQMVDLCRESNVKLGVGFMMRYHSLNIKLKEIIDNGDLGIPVLGRAQLTCWYPPIKDAWRQEASQGGGGALIDMGSHCIDLLESFFGPVREVGAFCGSLVHDYEVEDSSLAVLKFSNGAFGIVDNNFNVPDESALNILEIYGSEGSAVSKGSIGQESSGELTLRLDKAIKDYSAKQNREDTGSEVKIEAEGRNIYQAEIEDFAQAIIEDKAPPVSGEIGLHSMKVIEALYKSVKNKEFVRI